MNLVYDAKRYFYNQTGLGNYSRWLINSYAKFYPKDELLLLKPGNGPSLYEQKQLANIRSLEYNNTLGLARMFGLNSYLKNASCYHGLSNEIPYNLASNIKKIVTIHDLINYVRPQDYKYIDRWIYDKKLKNAIEKSDIIICISKTTKNDLQKYTNVDEKKIHIIYQGVDPIFKKEYHNLDLQSIKQKYNLPQQYWLSPSSFHPRKNQESIIEAYRIVDPNDRFPLVFTGNGNQKSKIKTLVDRYELNDICYFIGQVNYEDLPKIMQASIGVIYPSVYEGFGLPGLEALYCSIPIICHKGTSLEEACGPFGHYVDTNDSEALAHEIITIQSTSHHDHLMSNELSEYLRHFDDTNLSEQLNIIYNL